MLKPGIIIEFGVYRGRSLRRIAKIFPDRKVYGFDSFEGLTEPWYVYGVGAMSTNGKTPRGLPSNVELVIGQIEETLPEFLRSRDEPIALIHIDTDTYSAAKFILSALKNDSLTDGTVIIFDDYHNYPGYELYEYRAFREFRDSIPGKRFDLYSINGRMKEAFDRRLCTTSFYDLLDFLRTPIQTINSLFCRSIKTTGNPMVAFEVIEEIKVGVAGAVQGAHLRE